MFKFLHKIFTNNEPKIKEVLTQDLQLWLDYETSKHEFNKYIIKYFSKVNELKSHIFEKNKILEIQEIPEKHKVVEPRIQNIVIGHRDNYVKEVFYFLEKLECMEKYNFTASIQFNNTLNEMIDELAKKTGKSHEATEHLFAKEVEPIFKSVGELNLLVKKFSDQTVKLNIHEILKIQELIKQLHEDNNKNQELEKLVDECKEERRTLQNNLKNKKEKLTKLNESKELKELESLQEKYEKVTKDQKRLDCEIHSYFSKLQKPFRKYERLAPHNKTLKKYLEDSVIAFKEDKELDILLILNALKTNINIFNFDDRQETHFLELVEDGDPAYFKILHNREEDLLHQRKILHGSMSKINVMNDIKFINEDLSKLEGNMNLINDKFEKLDSKLQRNDLDEIKREITTRAKELLNVKLIIKNSP